MVLFWKSRGKQTVPNKEERLAKEDVMPTWSATQSLLLSQSTNSCTHTNTAVVAPLLKSPPTDYETLYTVLQLTQGISAQVVGPQRRTFITLDLDLCARTLKIQQSVGNTSCMNPKSWCSLHFICCFTCSCKSNQWKWP